MTAYYFLKWSAEKKARWFKASLDQFQFRGMPATS